MLKSADDIPALIAMMINKDECSDRHVDVMKLKGYSHFPGPSISVDGSDQPVPTIAVLFKDQNSPQMGRWKRFLEAFGIDNAIPKIDRVAHNCPYGYFAAKLAAKPAHCEGLVATMKHNSREVSFAVNLCLACLVNCLVFLAAFNVNCLVFLALNVNCLVFHPPYSCPSC